MAKHMKIHAGPYKVIGGVGTTIHLNNKPFVCPVCDGRFCRKTGLVRHMRIHSEEELQGAGGVIHTLSSLPFTCRLCRCRCIDESAMEQHMATHMYELNSMTRQTMRSVQAPPYLLQYQSTMKAEEPQQQ